jgi:MFS family permease
MAQDTSIRDVDDKTAKAEPSVISDQEAQIDNVMEANITKKFDRRIVPWLFGLWLLAFIDRSNIGNARIDGLSADLNLSTGLKFNTALTIYYVSYICVGIPSNWLIKRVGAGYYLPSLVIGWGIVSIGTGFVRTYQDLLAVRFLLGIFEGGLLGGMVLYLSMFYQRHQLMRRVGLFFCAAPLSGALGGLLATGLSQINTSSYHSW